ncbi:restriction endonuclease subunit S [Pelosinus fermentans]|uniref:Restriction modification system DNA specificity domain-containing protein n=1 Tax=Pelosinus fermentans JBW45 TaxID=1192197 RepID=I8U217_9FIRM|nr:restriction endonuclease subunit S [Pelosinus fermentans]AJQ27929.1 restriction modification system DNA specificity domain-containing protein [Pelosinus fermentans JBW45]
MKSKWDIVNLGKYISQQSIRNRGLENIEVYSVTNSSGFTKSTDYFNKEVFSKNLSNYKLVTREQFAYNPSRINVGSIACLFDANFALVSPLYVIFEVDKDNLFPEYLLRYLKSNYGNVQIRNNTQGSVRDSLKYEGLEKIQIPLPPLDDQIRIAAVLTRAEKLIAKRKESIKALDELLKSTFLEMFGDPVRNEKGWDKKEFDSVVKDFRNGQSPVSTGNIKGKVYTLSAITGGIFKGNEYKISTFESINDNSIVKNDDFLICRGNGNINLVGRSVVVRDISDKIIFPDTMICANIDITKINKKFIELMWKLSFVRKQIENFSRTTNGTYKINQQSLKSIIIIVPPVNLQNQFAAIVEKVEVLKAKYTQSLTDLENLYGSLSQRAFKGELDLSKVPLEKENQVIELYDEGMAAATMTSELSASKK